MASKNLFGGKKKTKKVPAPAPIADTVNEAGGRAYSRTSREELAQIVMTGFFGNTFYVSAKDQLDRVFELCKQVESEFIAKLAVEARERGFMKDSPALLCAILSTRGEEGRRLLSKIFSRVIDNGRMLRNFVQIIRSGQVGRKSLGSLPKNLVRKWFDSRDNEAIFKNSVGNDPSFGDIIKMVHPKPKTPSREELYAYMIGKEKDKKHLPTIVKAFERFKKSNEGELPDVPFEMLTGLTLSPERWNEMARNMSWTQLRMNLNTLQRHGVFSDPSTVDFVAAKLSDVHEVKRTKVFPYQIYSTLIFTEGNALPPKIVEALNRALEISLDNIPDLTGKNVFVLPDISGSMADPVGGHQEKVSSKMRNVDVAALVAAAMAKKGAKIVAFNTIARPIEQRQLTNKSVFEVAKMLSSMLGGGTACQAPLKYLNNMNERVDLALFISDNESWMQNAPSYNSGWQSASTNAMSEFRKMQVKNKNIKMVCIDVTPNGTVQLKGEENILNVGGFSDRVFNVITNFLEGLHGAEYWSKEIDRTII